MATIFAILTDDGIDQICDSHGAAKVECFDLKKDFGVSSKILMIVGDRTDIESAAYAIDDAKRETGRAGPACWKKVEIEFDCAIAPVGTFRAEFI